MISVIPLSFSIVKIQSTMLLFTIVPVRLSKIKTLNLTLISFGVGNTFVTKYPSLHHMPEWLLFFPVNLFCRGKKWSCSTNRTTGAPRSPSPAVRLFDSSCLGNAVGQTKQQDQTEEWCFSCNTQGEKENRWRRDLGSGWWLFMQCGWICRKEKCTRLQQKNSTNWPRWSCYCSHNKPYNRVRWFSLVKRCSLFVCESSTASKHLETL